MREADKAQLRLKVAHANLEGFIAQTHPQLDKRAYSAESVLTLRDSKRGYPTDSPINILRWRFSQADESMLPLSSTPVASLSRCHALRAPSPSLPSSLPSQLLAGAGRLQDEREH